MHVPLKFVPDRRRATGASGAGAVAVWAAWALSSRAVAYSHLWLGRSSRAQSLHVQSLHGVSVPLVRGGATCMLTSMIFYKTNV